MIITQVEKETLSQPDLEERLYVPSKFDKALDRLKFNQFTPNNIKRLAKKFKVDYKDALNSLNKTKSLMLQTNLQWQKEWLNQQEVMSFFN